MGIRDDNADSTKAARFRRGTVDPVRVAFVVSLALALGTAVATELPAFNVQVRPFAALALFAGLHVLGAMTLITGSILLIRLFLR